MSGLNWISYGSNSLGGNNLDYTSIVNFFNSPQTSISNGTVPRLQIAGNGYNIDYQDPSFTVFTGSTDYTAVQFYGYFIPPTTGNWTFNIGTISPNDEFNSDDVGIFFLGPMNSTIIPDPSVSSVSTSPSTSTPIIYNSYEFGSRTSGPMNLIAGNSYPILFYFNQSFGGYALGLSFSLDSGPIISDFAGYIYTSLKFPCFKEGTKILTNKGYTPVEDLRKGDLVKTLNHDFKPIDMIGKREMYHFASQERIKDQLYKYSSSEYPEIFEPLILTGCHCILVDNFISEEQKSKTIEVNGKVFITDNKYRLPTCLDPSASIYEIAGNYTIYHLALENDDYYMNYGIYANGLLVETCSKRYLKELSDMTLIE